LKTELYCEKDWQCAQADTRFLCAFLLNIPVLSHSFSPVAKKPHTVELQSDRHGISLEKYSHLQHVLVVGNTVDIFCHLLGE